LNLNLLKTNGRNQVQYRSGAANIYHCCVHKTGSQWIQKIFSAPAVHRYSGLKPYHYQTDLYGGRDSRVLKDRVFVEPFPTGTIVSPLYISFENFEAIPKPESHKAFFIQRDPRDILISWYFSARYSHTLSGNIARQRQALNTMSFEDGILYAINHLNQSGHFQAIASWIDAPKQDPKVMVVRFEDLIGPASADVFEALFEHCDIRIPRPELERLLAEHSFEALAGRKPGEEDHQAHYRKGISGDWKNYLSDTLVTRFDDLTNNLAARLNNPVLRSQIR
jgi:hypothetical protein